MIETINEKCAVGAITSTNQTGASNKMHEMLFAMQHRGEGASGIATYDGSPIRTHSEQGMVPDVYSKSDLDKLRGQVAIGHNLYSTYDVEDAEELQTQPILDKDVDLAFAHNGNLPVTQLLESHLNEHNIRTKMANDSRMMSMAIAQQIRNNKSLPDAVESTYELFRGAFSCVAMQDGLVVAFRDPKGIRPLALGKTDDNEHVIASETCALDIIGAQYVREVKPGEMIILDGKSVESKQLAEGKSKLDMFEFVYFARHDSKLYGQRVNGVRRRFGEQLAIEHPPLHETNKNTLVVPVPDSSIPAAEGYAETLGLRHHQSIIKNRNAGRTFMTKEDKTRQDQLRKKHNIIPEDMEDHDVIVIDDSIVRLNTMPKLVKLIKAAGARSVSVLVASPPVRFPDFYGIDTPSQDELAAANLTVEQIREKLGVDYLGYLSLGGLVKATGLAYEDFNLSCFNGEYPIGIGHRKSEIRRPISMEGAE